MTCFDHAIGELDEQRTEDRAKVYPIDQFGVERGNNHTHVRLTLQHFAGIEFDAVGGLTLGADALSVAVAAAADSRWFIVRKEPKGRGTGRWIEGAQIGDGDRVLLIDDVITTGGSTMKAYEQVVATGATVVAASTLVDRGDTATVTFGNFGIAYFPMITYTMLGIAPVEGTPIAPN